LAEVKSLNRRARRQIFVEFQQHRRAGLESLTSANGQRQSPFFLGELGVLCGKLLILANDQRPTANDAFVPNRR
jgi:hypothetical protein